MLGFNRITFDPNVMGGRACIRGMRVTVSLVVNLVANGMSIEEILEAYPYLDADDIRQALQYAPRTGKPPSSGDHRSASRGARKRCHH